MREALHSEAIEELLPLAPYLQLYWIFLVEILKRDGEIAMTQTPASLSVIVGESVTILCKASTSIYDKAPKLLIDEASDHHTGIPAQFSGSGYGTDFTFTISKVEAVDAGDYYCQQYDEWPLTVIQTNTKTSLCCAVCIILAICFILNAWKTLLALDCFEVKSHMTRKQNEFKNAIRVYFYSVVSQ
uniref:Immunoglobulin domain-containing protein n=1 Tax=Gopherus agassizii TaxID=38772 RepID=A0A452HDJ2_9SAUR